MDVNNWRAAGNGADSATRSGADSASAARRRDGAGGWLTDHGAGCIGLSSRRDAARRAAANVARAFAPFAGAATARSSHRVGAAAYLARKLLRPPAGLLARFSRVLWRPAAGTLALCSLRDTRG